MKKFKGIIIFLTVFSFILAGCSTSQDTGQSDAESISLTVSAAASLTDCMEEIKELYIKENPNIDITYNFAGSGSLQQQIEQGAPADIFFSAGKKQMNALVDADLMLNDSVEDILENKVVLVTPKGEETISSFDELLEDNIEKVAIGDPGSVPAGQYAQEVLNNLNLYNEIESKIVFAKDVREVLSWVETMNVDAGLVYKTDAQISDKITISTVAPEGSHTPVIYPVGIVKYTKNAEESQKFMNFLFEEEAKELFIKYGFSPLS